MDNIPVLKSKLVMPELSKEFLLTGRLKKLHRQMELHRAATVCAPAGYGKTTLAVSFFDCHLQSRAGACWYRLEPDDRSLPVFISHLLETLFPFGETAFAEMKAFFNNVSLRRHPQQAITQVCRELWKLHEQNAGPARFIVLDDFHNAAQSEDIRAAVIYMLDHIPPSCRLILLSRLPERVFTERQNLENELLLIEGNDLAFDKNEIRLLVQKMKHCEPDVKTVNAIAGNTEGWVAGIIILCKTPGGENLNDLFTKGRLRGENALFRYISAEVVRRVDKATGDMLAKLALLRDFSADDALNILGMNEVNSLAGRCLEFGIFIETIPGSPPVYRFHPLFKDFLYALLEDSHSVDQIEEWHLAAAGYYIETGRYGRAAEHIAMCGNLEKATELVTGVGIKFMLVGESGQLKTWLELLPPALVSENPVLLVFKALLLPQDRHKDAEHALKQAFRVSQKQGNLMMQYRAATSLVYIHYCNNNMAGMVSAAESILSQNTGQWEHHAAVPGLLELMRSIGKSLFSRGGKEGSRVPYSALDDEDRWLFLAYSSIIECCLGRLDDAGRRMETALALDCVRNVEPARATALYLLSAVLALKNDPSRLLPQLSELRAIAAKYDLLYHLAGADLWAAYERYLAHDTAGAVKLLESAASLYSTFDNHAMAAVARLLKRLWSEHPGGSEATLDEARRDVDLVRRMKAGVLLYEIALSVLGALAREAGDLVLAEKCLLSSIEAASRKKGNQVLCGSRFHMAALYFTGGSPAQGRHHLEAAMKLATHGLYHMFWDIHIETTVEMVLRALRYGCRAAFGRELLLKFFDRNAVLFLAEKARSMPENRIRDFTVSFVSAYRKGLTGQLYIVRASLFGKAEVLVNGIAIPDAEWKTRKVRGLLEYLLLNSGRTVSKETLLEIFWPESDGKSSAVSLRTALYQLRKTLSRYGAAVTGENAFIFETLDGIQVRMNDSLELDLNRFLELERELSGHGGGVAGERTARKDLLKTMISLYRGELIEGSDYGDRHIFEREKCRLIFEDACLKLSAIYIHDEEPGLAEKTLRQVLTADPYNDKACLELLNLYVSQGLRGKAVKLYNSFKKRVKNDLNLELDERFDAAIAHLKP